MVEVLFPPVTRRAGNKNKSEMNRCLPIWLSRPTSHQPSAIPRCLDDHADDLTTLIFAYLHAFRKGSRSRCWTSGYRASRRVPLLGQSPPDRAPRVDVADAHRQELLEVRAGVEHDEQVGRQWSQQRLGNLQDVPTEAGN